MVSTIIVVLVIAAVVGLIIADMVRKKRRGEGGCGCGCSNCSGICHKK